MSSLYSLNSRFATIDQRFKLLEKETKELFEDIVSTGGVKFTKMDLRNYTVSEEEIRKLKESGKFYSLPCVTLIHYERGNEQYVLEVNKNGRILSIDKEDNSLSEHGLYDIMYLEEKQYLLKEMLEKKNKENDRQTRLALNKK